MNSISVGAGTNIQDNSLVHVAKSNLSGKVLPTIIGDNVTVGEGHACLPNKLFSYENDMVHILCVSVNKYFSRHEEFVN